jgi:hypothetical protein
LHSVNQKNQRDKLKYYWSARIDELTSLVRNLNARKKTGTAWSKKDSNVAPKAYKNMKAGWPNSKKNKGKKNIILKPLIMFSYIQQPSCDQYYKCHLNSTQRY